MRFPVLTLVIAAPLALAASAAPRPAPNGSTFATDPRLQAPLTLAVNDRPLGEVLRDVAAQTHVKLTAGRDTADDRATLFTDGRPAAETLGRLAEHFGFVWVRAGEGWELTQSTVSRHHEEELRLADLAPIRQEAEQMAALADVSSEKLEEEVQALYAEMREPGIDPARRQTLELKTQVMRKAAAGPGMSRASLSLIRSLQPAQLRRLVDGERLRLTTAEGSITPEFARQIATFYRSTNDQGAQRQAEMVVWLADGERVEYGPVSRKDRTLVLFIAYNSIRGEGANFEMISRVWSAGDTHGPHLAAPIPDDPFFKKTVDLKLPELKRDRLLVSDPCPEAGRNSLTYVWPAWPTVGDLAEALHRAGGPQVVADSFISARFDPDRLRGKRTVGDVLQFLDGELDYTWRREGDLLLLRSRHYYRERPREVPERLVRTWARGVSGKGEMVLDDLAGLAVTLTDAQARSLDDYWGWYFQPEQIGPPDWFFANRYHLRFWGGLSPVQREAARSGTLPVSALGPAQQKAWLAALASPPRNAYTPSPFKRAPSDTELAAGGFSLSSRNVKEQLLDSHLASEKSYRFSRFVVSADRPLRTFKATQDGAPTSVGDPTPATEYRLQYHLAAEAKPALSMVMILPKSKAAAR